RTFDGVDGSVHVGRYVIRDSQHARARVRRRVVHDNVNRDVAKVGILSLRDQVAEKRVHGLDRERTRQIDQFGGPAVALRSTLLGRALGLDSHTQPPSLAVLYQRYSLATREVAWHERLPVACSKDSGRRTSSSWTCGCTSFRAVMAHRCSSCTATRRRTSYGISSPRASPGPSASWRRTGAATATARRRAAAPSTRSTQSGRWPPTWLR